MARQAIFALSICLGACGVGKVFTGLGGNGARTSDGADGNTDGTGTGTDDGTTSTTSTTPSVTPAPISPDAPGCGRGQVAPARRTPLHFVFVLDRSGSMNDDNEAQAQNRATKWESLQAAMTAVFEDLGKAADAGDDSIAVGVNYFSESADNNSGPETIVEFPLEQLTRGRANTLKSDISSRNARGYTPTEKALTLSYDALTAYTPTGSLENGTKVVILVSDGKPNPAPATPDTIPNLVASKKTAGVRTFSIGIGEIGSGGTNGYEPGLMSTIADRGGTAKQGCDPTNATDPTKFCHFQITPSASTNITNDLVAAFNAIRDQVRSCELPLNIEKPNELEPRAVVVVAEKDNAPQRILVNDASNGWTFDSAATPTSIRLHGAECDKLKSNETKRVFAIVGCACTLANGSTPGGGQGESQPGPARQESGPGSVAGEWNTNWCSYSYVTLPPGSCTGEGCP